MVQFRNITRIEDPMTECVVKSGHVLEIDARSSSSEGGCAISFNELRLPPTESLSNQVLEFDMEFLIKPASEVGRHGGIYYGDHELGRFRDGNVVLDWIDRPTNLGYRFYESGLNRTHQNTFFFALRNESANHLKIIVKSNGEHIIVVENFIWKIQLTTAAIPSLGKPCLGFWAWPQNHIRISNFIIRPYKGETCRTRVSKSTESLFCFFL